MSTTATSRCLDTLLPHRTSRHFNFTSFELQRITEIVQQLNVHVIGGVDHLPRRPCGSKQFVAQEKEQVAQEEPGKTMLLARSYKRALFKAIKIVFTCFHSFSLFRLHRVVKVTPVRKVLPRIIRREAMAARRINNVHRVK